MRWYKRSETTLSISLPTQEVRLMGRKDVMSAGGLPDFKIGIISAFRQACGTRPVEREQLKRLSSSCLANGPMWIRKEGGIESGPQAPLGFILLMASFSSSAVMGSWTRGDFRS